MINAASLGGDVRARVHPPGGTPAGGYHAQVLRAVLFDFGGVLTTSPFEAFASYERERGLPEGFLRQVNATNPDDNAWARLERGQLSVAEFDAAFASEAAQAGHPVPGTDVLGLLAGELRPAMINAVGAIRATGSFSTGLLTNNAAPLADSVPGWNTLAGQFDVVVESSRIGVRKPDPRFYAVALEGLGIAPAEAVFLDDLGVNLKPARAMGMATIKVTDPGEALDELGAMLGVQLT